MEKNTQWATLACFMLLPANAMGHPLTFEGKTLVEVREWCVGNMKGYEPGTMEMVVDEQDVAIFLEEYFGAECSAASGCFGDWNHTHVLAQGDLGLILANWGPCRDRVDVNGDGDVNHEDVAEVVADLGDDCDTDLDFNGLVQGNDLNIAQLAWGPGDDYNGDVNRNGFLEIGEDLLAVVNALARVCTSDVIPDGDVDCNDLERVCQASVDCCDVSAVTCDEDFTCPCTLLCEE